MAASGQRAELRSALSSFATGRDRGQGAVDRLRRLVEAIDDVPWRNELAYVLTNYVPASDATGEVPLAALAELVLDDWAKKKPETRWRLRVPDDAKGLDARWGDATGRDRAAAVIRAMTGHDDLRSIAFGEHEGRLDLRGFVDPDPDPRRPVISSLDGADFSGARLGPLRFDRQTIRNCRFDGASLRDFRLWSTSMSDSSFRGADFGDMAMLFGHSIRRLGPLPLGTLPAGRHIRVDFSGSRLSDAWFKGGGFEDCDFSNAHLSRAIFECDLVRCRFAGHLHDIAFFGRSGLFGRAAVGSSRHRLEDVDLREAELHYVDFRGVDLDNVHLPEYPQLRVMNHWPCIRDFLTGRFPNEKDRPLVLRHALGLRVDPLPPHGRVVLDLRTLEEDTGREAIAQLAMMLDEAEAHCRGTPAGDVR